MAGIKLEINLPKMGNSNNDISRIVKELSNKPKAQTKEVIKTVRVKDKKAEEKVTRLQRQLMKVKSDLAAVKKQKPKVITKTIIKKQVIKESGSDETMLAKQFKALKNSIPTTSHIGGDV